MPFNEWSTVDWNGKQYLQWEGLLRVPLDWDSSTGVFIAVTPPGGLANLPALVKGDNGLAPVIQLEAEVTELEWDDPSPVTTDWVLVTPATETVGPVYKEVKTVRKGPPGDVTSGNIVDATDLDGTPTAQKIIVRNAANNGFEYKTQKVGNIYWPGAVTAATNVTSATTICAVPIPAQDFDWRPVVSGGAWITANASDVAVDLMARLNGETAGNIIGRNFGSAGMNEFRWVPAAPPPGTTDASFKVLAGNSATVHLRAERQLGTGTFSTFTTANFSVQVVPIP